jgi:hypothetical protein
MRLTYVSLRLLLAAVACAGTLGVSRLTAQTPGEDGRAAALRLFDARVNEYAALHRRLEGPLPPLTPTKETLRNHVLRQLLASAIRRARAGAQQGDIFEPGVALVFRGLIADALQGRDATTFLAEFDEEDPPSDAALVVNEPLPRGSTHAMPSRLLQILPPLPEDVEYRIVNRNLVLWDIHADLVIDFLPKAFTPTATTRLTAPAPAQAGAIAR